MPPRRSAGIVLYRHREGGLEVLLGHLGGPLWARKDDLAWSIPKGEYDAEETPFAAAVREFAEELGSPPPDDGYLELGEITQANGKRVTAWAVAGDFDPATLVSNTFEMEWPPRSGRRDHFPETDRAEWFDLETARGKVHRGQAALFDRLVDRLAELSPGQTT